MFRSIFNRFPLRHSSQGPLTSRARAYRSALSLEHLYPKSSLSLSVPVKVPASLENGAFTGYIPIDKLKITYCRSSGPGGQNVNVSNTKVEMRFHVQSADWLSEKVKEKMIKLFKNRITNDGFLIVKSEKTRSQLYNQADAMMMLRHMIWKAESDSAENVLSEETLHMLRKRKERANRERLREKRMRSHIKQLRTE